MTETDIAWAAALWEGEGCFAVRPPRGTQRFPTCHLVLGMCDRDVVERFAALMECGNVYHIRLSEKRRQAGSRKDQWRWEVGNKKDALRIATMFLPYLGERRAAKAREIIEVASRPDGRSTGITLKHPHLVRP